MIEVWFRLFEIIVFLGFKRGLNRFLFVLK